MLNKSTLLLTIYKKKNYFISDNIFFILTLTLTLTLNALKKPKTKKCKFIDIDLYFLIHNMF